MSTQFPSSFRPIEGGAFPQKRRGLPSSQKPLPSLPIPFLPGPNLPQKDYIRSRPEGFLKQVHYEVFSVLFGENIEEVRSTYRRMVRFARDSGVGTDAMVDYVKRGRQVANEIVTANYADEYSADDLAAFDWFLRAQHAKMDKLYSKGTTKFTDPDHHFAPFLRHVRGQNHGQDAHKKGPYPRPSSHLPEEKQQGLGIDASGKNIHPPGKKSGTYLFHLYKEKDRKRGIDVPVVVMKAETSSVAPIDRKKTYGSPSVLLKDKTKHGLKLYKKIGSIDQNSRKEDKLPPSVCKLLANVEIKKGERGSRLRNSYNALKKTTEMGNDASLVVLYNHLKLQGEKAVINEIEAIFQKSREMQEGSEYLLFPRGQEVILPSLKEMLENKVKFASNLTS